MAEFNDLPIEVVLKIATFLTDKEKLRLFLLNKRLRNSLNLLTFDKLYDYKIRHYSPIFLFKKMKINIKFFIEIKNLRIRNQINWDNITKIIFNPCPTIKNILINKFYPYFKIVNEIVFHLSFNTPITNLPECVKKLSFIGNYTHNLTNVSVKEIEFYNNFNITILPTSIEKLNIIGRYNHNLFELSRYKKLKHLILPNYCNNYIHNFSDTVEILEIGFKYINNLNNFPKNLTHLIIYNDFTGELSNLPITMRKITIKLFQNFNEIPNDLDIKLQKCLRMNDLIEISTIQTDKFHCRG